MKRIFLIFCIYSNSILPRVHNATPHATLPPPPTLPDFKETERRCRAYWLNLLSGRRQQHKEKPSKNALKYGLPGRMEPDHFALIQQELRKKFLEILLHNPRIKPFH